MTVQQKFCINHPQRAAIGVCVITRVPICGECSTRYEGVNYSKEGLQILQRQRNAVPKHSRRTLSVLVWVLSPATLYLLYLSYWIVAAALTNMLHRDF